MERNGAPTPLAMGRISVSEVATASLAQPCLAAPAHHQLSEINIYEHITIKKGSGGMLVGILCSVAPVCHVSLTGLIPANGFCRGMVGICGGCFCCQLRSIYSNLKAIPPSTPVQTWRSSCC